MCIRDRSLSVHYLGLSAINLFGTEEQKIKFMTNACLGKEIASFAFTEPDTGSDPKQINTTATKKGDYYILNGIKRFISSADLKGPMVVFANEESSGKNTAFVIHKMCQGYTLSSMWDKIGLKGNRSYDAVSYTHLDVYKRQPWDLPNGELQWRSWNQSLPLI